MSASAAPRSSDFVEEGFHRRFQGITTLLSSLDAITPREREDNHNRVLMTSAQPKGGSRRLFEYLREAYLIPLVREHDDVSMMISGDGQNKNGQVTIVAKDASLHFAAKPRRDEFSPSRNTSQPTEVTPIWISNETNVVPDDQDVITFALEAMAAAMQANRAVDPAGRIDNYPIVDHITYYVHLLRACHLASNDDAYKVARKRLFKYIHVSGYARTLKRLRFGRGKRNFFEVLITTLEAHKISDRPVEEDAPFRDIAPTAPQRKLLDGILAIMSDPPTKYPHYLYDQRGREWFHDILGWLLLATEGRLKRLNQVIGDRHRMTVPEIATFRKNIHMVPKLIRDYSRIVALLHRFLMDFDQVLRYHLRWLNCTLELKGSKDLDYAKRQGRAEHVVNDEDAQHSAESDDEESDDESDHLDTVESGMDAVEDHFERLEPNDKGWAGAALKYLQLICIQEASLGRTPRKIKSRVSGNESTMILDSKIAFVEVKQKDWTGFRWSRRRCLELLTAKDSSLNFGELAQEITTKATKSRSDQDWLDGDKFSGTLHCEAVLLALRALRALAVDRVDLSDTDLLELDGIFSVSNELLKKLGKSLPMLLVTKRCCPACWTVAKVILARIGLKAGNAKIIAPGYHTVWTPVALPRFLTADIAKECLHHAESQALTKLQGLQRLIDSRQQSTPKQDSSPHSAMGSAEQQNKPDDSSEDGDVSDILDDHDDGPWEHEKRYKSGKENIVVRQLSPKKHPRDGGDKDETELPASPTKKERLTLGVDA